MRLDDVQIEGIIAWTNDAFIRGPHETAHIAKCLPDTIRALATEVLESRAAEERWRSNSRETFDAMVAMRNDINEHIPLPSIESDLARGPGNDVFCAEVAQGVVTTLAAKDAEIARLTKERDEARAEIADSKLENGYVIGWNSGWDEAFQRLKFPTMLRKMWSGGDVQRWLDERRAEQTGPIPESMSERMFAADARVAELEGALAQARAWHESEAKALSKSGRSDADYHWRRGGHADQIADIRQVLPDAEYHTALERINARAALGRDET
jgi:hypothetical protein